MSLIIQLDDIPEDAGLRLDFVEEPECFEMDESECSLNSGVHIKGVLTKLGQEIFLAGKIKTGMNLSCSRCLKTVQFSVDSDISVCFIPQKDSLNETAADMELSNSDLEVEYYSDNKINLTPPVYDQIILSLPIVTLCQIDCKGICSHCGKNLNAETCDCKEEGDIDPRLAILKNLKDNL